MRYLLDTHALIWALFSPNNLNQRAVFALSNPENTVYVSAASLWEISIKHAKRPEIMIRSAEETLEAAKQAGFEILPIKPEHLASLEGIVKQGVHADPFDHLLLSTAKEEQLTLLSNDNNILQYQGVFLEAC